MSLKDSLLSTILKDVNEDIGLKHNMITEEIETTISEAMPTLLHTHPIDQYLVLNRRYGVLNRVKSIDEYYTSKTKGWLPKGNGTIQRLTDLEEDHEIIDSELSDEEQLPSKTLGYFPSYKSREMANNKVDEEFIMIPSEGSKVFRKTLEKDYYDTDDEEEGILVDSEIGEQEIISKISESLHNQVNSPEITTMETNLSCALSPSPPSPTFLPSSISLNLSFHPKLTSNDTKMLPWTSDEDKLLIDAVLESLAPSWVKISENIMMQRSEDACRLRWARLKKRLYGSV
ncbi:37649_t:CDS:2 [Gigaspora margarita]|uniref:37649_t:CDS:1 n=1 Tax=Gigaspora margarita TaxID=4874 RepID=A0ABN7UD23_GIGMA|nr:37649_t:CDS:2 [Gigaspora margarita]